MTELEHRLALIQDIATLVAWDEEKRLRAIHRISDLRRGEPYLSDHQRPRAKLPPPGQGDGRTCSRGGCDQPILRARNEGAVGWHARRFCSRRCAALDRRGNERRRAAAAVGERACCICGAALAIRPHERPSEYAVRTTCSMGCRAALAYANRKDRQSAGPSERSLGRAKEGLTSHSSSHSSARSSPPEPKLPDPRPTSDYQPATMTADPNMPRCGAHPHETVGPYGCPICNVGRRWRENSRTNHPQGETWR